ncbi:hypothetical protein NO1_1827 [Candidatus Termititenax aidoneus]|uniref:Uncharacterized protein n=1 Tax=Termititenax aidoneus TaxID=2218524 RepID=A0A388TCT4_TERA1|nr:hypothetical protein NO1_1827 [Candidatus Termititenax aidoneus]
MLELIMHLNKISNAALDNTERTLCQIEKVLKGFVEDKAKGGEL